MALALLYLLVAISTDNRANSDYWSVREAEKLIALPTIAELELDQPIFLTNSALWNRLVRNAGMGS